MSSSSTLRLVDLRLGLQILRVLRDLDIGIAAELGELNLRLLAQRFELVLVVAEGGLRLIENGLGNGMRAQKHRVAVVGGLIELDQRLLCGNVAQHAFIVLLHRLDGQRGLRQSGLGVVERDLKLQGVEAVENLAGRDVLVVVHVHVFDDAGHVGRDPDLVGFHIGIIRRHDLAAGDVPVTADQKRKRQEREQRPAHPVAAPEPADLLRGGGWFLGPRFRLRRRRKRQRSRSFRRLIADRRRRLTQRFSHSGDLPPRRLPTAAGSPGAGSL